MKEDIFAKRLREAMEFNNMTQAELAQKSGLWPSAISDYLNNKYKAKQDKVAVLAKALNVSPSWLLGVGDDKESKADIDLESIPGIIPLKKVRRIPIIGTIACGSPIWAEENFEGYFLLDEKIDADFCVYAKGDSMKDIGIDEGDLIFLKKQSSIENGKVGAVLIDNEATLKKVFKTNDGLILQPCNAEYPPIIIDEEDHKDVLILGEMVGFYHNI